MGFSIGRFFKSIVGVAAPAVGALLGGPVGAAIGTAVASGFASKPAQAAPIGLPSIVGPSVGPLIGVGRGLLGPIGGAIIGALGLKELLDIARSFTGKPVSRQKVVDAVKHCGIALTAQMFGLSETQVCEIVISKGRRRGRGISAADMRRTRSTIRKVHNISHDLQALVPRVRRHHRSKA